MPSTPNFGWPTPEDTAQVANGPAIIRALGDAADATVFAQGTAIAAQGTAIADLDAKNIPDFTDDVPSDGQALVFDEAVGKYAPQAVAPPTTDGFLFAATRYFFSDGTFAKDDPLGTGDIGLRAVRVRLVAGGAGGGGANTTTSTTIANGGGGGGGAYAESFLLADDLTASVAVVVALGGAGGDGTSGFGGDGGNSSFGSGETFEVSAEGGDGGQNSIRETPPLMRVPGQGGSTFVGDLGVAGSAGGLGQSFFAVSFASSSGKGGHTFLGGEADARRMGTAGSAGSDGNLFGGGGSGASNNVDQSVVRNGGSGAAGIVIVDCFV